MPEPGSVSKSRDEVGVVAILARAVRVDERRQFQTRPELDQHILEGFALAFGREHRNAHRIARPVELGDRPVEHRHHVVALEIGRVGQHEIGERRHLGFERVADDQKRNAVLALLVAIVQHFPHGERVHGRVPRHVRHEDEKRVDAVRIAAPCVRDDVVHHPVHRKRMLPRERLVDSDRPALLVDEQFVRSVRPCQRQRTERFPRLHRRFVPESGRRRRNGTRERRLVPEAARAIDRAEHRHHDRERTDGLKTVGMRGETAHRVKGDGIAGHRLVLHAPTVGPRNRKLDRLVARRDAQLVRQSANRGGGHAGDVLGPFGRVIAHALDEKLKRGLHRFAVGQPELACEIRIGAARMVQRPARC